MRIRTVHRLAWNVAYTLFWAAWLQFLPPLPTDGWILLAVPARLLGAFWFVSSAQAVKKLYAIWEEERLHRHIKPILTEPPETRP